jgi:hypothetical protein
MRNTLVRDCIESLVGSGGSGCDLPAGANLTRLSDGFAHVNVSRKHDMKISLEMGADVSWEVQIVPGAVCNGEKLGGRKASRRPLRGAVGSPRK